jgi:hypothetical protein
MCGGLFNVGSFVYSPYLWVETLPVFIYFFYVLFSLAVLFHDQAKYWGRPGDQRYILMVKSSGSKTGVPLWCYGCNDASAGQQLVHGCGKTLSIAWRIVALSSHYRFFTNLYSRMGVLRRYPRAEMISKLEPS